MTEKQKSDLMRVAKSLIGKPYKYGARPEEAPEFFDCSSFTQYVFKRVGTELPRSSILQAVDAKGKEIKPKNDFSDLEIGDLIFMRGRRGYYNDDLFDGHPISIGHVALYIGGGKVVHAREKLKGVAGQPLTEVVREPNYQVVFVKRF